MTSKHLMAPGNNSLKVTGTGLTPQPSPSASPDSSKSFLLTPSMSFISDNGSEQSKQYTVLDGVREMKQMLEKQIDTLRRQIAVNEQDYNAEKAKLLEVKDSEIRQRETEIEGLKESLIDRDENIQKLRRIGAEKDKTIQVKSLEIDDLSKMVRQIKDNIQKIRKQMKRKQNAPVDDKPGDDSARSRTNEDIAELKDEMDQLRARLAEVEQELGKAVKLIEQQNEKLEVMDKEKDTLLAKLKEDLDKMSKGMRQEVERTREMMWQNVEEMKGLREINKETQCQIHEIKKMLEASRTEKSNFQGKNVQTTTLTLSHERTAIRFPSTSRETPDPKFPSVKKTLVSKPPSKSMNSLPPIPGRFPLPYVRKSMEFITVARGSSFHVSPSQALKPKGNTITESTPTSRCGSVGKEARPDLKEQAPMSNIKHASVLNHAIYDHNKFNNNQHIPPITARSEGQTSARRRGKTDIKKGPAIRK